MIKAPKVKPTDEDFLVQLQPQLEAKKREIAIYKSDRQNDKINQCREDIIELLIKRDKITQKSWRTSPDTYYQGFIEDRI